jgi:hypothetical protein
MIKCKDCKFCFFNQLAKRRECHADYPIISQVSGKAIWPILNELEYDNLCCGNGVKHEKRKVNYGNRI